MHEARLVFIRNSSGGSTFPFVYMLMLLITCLLAEKCVRFSFVMELLSVRLCSVVCVVSVLCVFNYWLSVCFISKINQGKNTI